MIRYITVEKEAEASLTIEKSKFIAHVRRADNRSEAEAFLSEIRKKHRDATHNVPVFVIGEKQELQWASDDGEPSGTSGSPILQMVVKEGLTNVAVVVTRYFGGIKLGTGGLVRAYTAAARLALDEAGKFEVRDYIDKVIKIQYSDLAGIKNLAASLSFEITDVIYEDEVKLTIKFESEKEDEILSKLSDFSLGKMKILY